MFAELGYDAPIAAIAERAGVGVASIYRRFTNKDQLVHDMRVMALTNVTALARASLASAESSTVREFLERHVREAASPLTMLTRHGFEDSPEIAAAASELFDALEQLIAPDLSAGIVPADYCPGELMVAVAHVRPRLPASRERSNELDLRHVDAYLAGLAAIAAGTASMRGTPMEWSEWVTLYSSGSRD